MLDKLYSLIYSDLIINSPVLSGNMQWGIQLGQIGNNEVEIVINAPFYDLAEYKKSKVVKHTGKVVGGATDYAAIVNKSGAFASHNDSEHWVNRILYNCCEAIANEVGGVVINELQL